MTTRANGPPGQQRGEDGTPYTMDTHASTVLRKPDDRVLSAAVEEVGTALVFIDTNEADVLGICCLRVAVEDLPTSSGGNVTQNVSRRSILMQF